MQGYSPEELIDMAWLDAAGKYTVDFGGSNFYRVAGLAAQDIAQKYPNECAGAMVDFVAGGVFEKLRSFQREVMKNREG